MKTFQLTTAAILAIMIIFTGCKKDKDEDKKPDCRIITITPTTGNSFNISYNSDGKVNTVSTGSDITTFAYSGNTIIGTTTNSGTFSSKKIITLGSNGLAANVKTENNVSGTDWKNDAYEYSGTELIKATSTSSSGGTPSVSMVTWSNGNLISVTTGSNISTLDYFTDKSAQTGDYLQIVQLISGFQIYKTKNAIKSLLSGSTITSFDYNFDTGGKITSLTATGGTNITYTYQHQCN